MTASRRVIVFILCAFIAISMTVTVPSGAPVSTASAGGARRHLPSVGAQFHATWAYDTHKQRVRMLNKLKRAGVRWVRIDVGWNSLQEDGRNGYERWYVRQLSRIVRAARNRNLKVMATFWGSPYWARADHSRAGPPRRLRDYGRAVRYLAKRFRGRISAYEIWNEPNHPDYWTKGPGRYADMLRIAYKKINDVAPRAKVVSGATSMNDYHWIAKMLRAGGRNHYDVMATNGYTAPANLRPEAPYNGTIYRMASVKQVHRVMVRHHDGRKPIWFGEFGWSSHKNNGNEENWELGVSKRKQARYLVRALKFLGCRFPYVKRVFWYMEKNRRVGQRASKMDIQRANYGLLKPDMRRKPAYRALDNLMEGPDRLRNC